MSPAELQLSEKKPSALLTFRFVCLCFSISFRSLDVWSGDLFVFGLVNKKRDDIQQRQVRWNRRIEATANDFFVTSFLASKCRGGRHAPRARGMKKEDGGL